MIVFNKTKVFPARIEAQKETGGKLEVLFLSAVEPKKWQVMIGGKVTEAQKIIITKKLIGIVKKTKQATFLTVNLSKLEVFEELESYGKTPLPPYIKRTADKNDQKEYQTVFAEKIGSAAAPTASLHFTKELLKTIKDHGVQIEYVTLHVGLGTFAPVKTEKVEDHPIHSEYFEIDEPTANRINKAKADGRRIIACGTTVVRTLEAAAQTGSLVAQKTETKLFIYPGFKFQIVDGMITNFHTPKSSLLALVFAFAGKENIRNAYAHAIKNKYRFFSYGDGMLIL